MALWFTPQRGKTLLLHPPDREQLMTRGRLCKVRKVQQCPWHLWEITHHRVKKNPELPFPYRKRKAFCSDSNKIPPGGVEVIEKWNISKPSWNWLGFFSHPLWIWVVPSYWWQRKEDAMYHTYYQTCFWTHQEMHFNYLETPLGLQCATRTRNIQGLVFYQCLTEPSRHNFTSILQIVLDIRYTQWKKYESKKEVEEQGGKETAVIKQCWELK